MSRSDGITNTLERGVHAASLPKHLEGLNLVRARPSIRLLKRHKCRAPQVAAAGGSGTGFQPVSFFCAAFRELVAQLIFSETHRLEACATNKC